MFFLNKRQAKKKLKKQGRYKDTRLEKISYQDFMNLPKKVRKKEIERSLKRIEKEMKRFEKKNRESFHYKTFKAAQKKGFKNEKELVQNIQFFEKGASRTVEGQEEIFNKVYDTLVEGQNKFGYNEDGSKRKLNKKMVRSFLESERFAILKMYGDSGMIMDTFFNAVDKGYKEEEIYKMFNAFISDKITFDKIDDYIEEGVHFE